MAGEGLQPFKVLTLYNPTHISSLKSYSALQKEAWDPGDVVMGNQAISFH